MMCNPQLGVNLPNSPVFFCRQHASSLAHSTDSLSAYKLFTVAQGIFSDYLQAQYRILSMPAP